MAELTFTLTESQFCAAQRLHLSFQPRWIKAIFAVIGIAGIVLLATGLYHQKYGLALLGLFYTLFLLLRFPPFGRQVGNLAMLLLRPLLLRSFRRSPSLHQQSRVQLQDGQLHMQSDTATATLPWKYIIDWAEDAHSILLYLQPRLFLITPKDIDPQSLFIAPLREQLLQHVGPPKK